MRNISTYLTLLICSVVILRAQEDPRYPRPRTKVNGVIQLTDETFDSYITSNTHVFVKIYKKDCPHCKKIEKDFEEIAMKLDQKAKRKWKIAELDSAQNRKIHDKLNIEAVPTMIAFIKQLRYDVTVPKGKYNWIKYLKQLDSYQLPTITSMDDMNKAKLKFPVTFYLHGMRETQAVADTKSMGLLLQEDNRVEFYHIKECKECLHGLLIKPSHLNTMNAIRRYDAEETIVWKSKGSVDMKHLKSFVYNNLHPLVSNWSRTLLQEAENAHKSIMIFIYPLGKPKVTDNILQEFKMTCLELREDLDKVLCAKVRFTDPQFDKEEYKINKTMIPGILMIKGNGAKYLFPEEKFEIKNIIRWERNVRRGKAKKYVWEPDNRGKNVITLVETTIENAIRDPKKDVLVMYSAPWCEQCTMFKPYYEKIGKHFAKDENIIIAEIDATVNDVTEPIQEYPTFVIYPAENSPKVTYEIDEEANIYTDIIEFVETNQKTRHKTDL